MSEEFYIETLEKIKEYMQNSIDKGYHKFIYNDLDWDVKCVDVISAIDMLIDKNNEFKKYYQCEKNLLSNYISKDKIRAKLEELKWREQELTDGQGYWGSTDLLEKIDLLEELLEE